MIQTLFKFKLNQLPCKVLFFGKSISIETIKTIYYTGHSEDEKEIQLRINQLRKQIKKALYNSLQEHEMFKHDIFIVDMDINLKGLINVGKAYYKLDINLYLKEKPQANQNVIPELQIALGPVYDVISSYPDFSFILQKTT